MATHHSFFGAFTARIILLLFACTVLTTAHEPPPRRQVPGIGIALSPDHGTAAIHFANSTTAHVAKIEGSPSYKRFMRDHDHDSSTAPTSAQQPFWCPALAHLPSFLRTACPTHPPSSSSSSSPVQPLLSALKTALESYLGTAICFADVAVPAELSAPRRAAIRAALAAAGLRPALPAAIDDAKAAAVAQGVRSDDERAVLAVDRSRARLAAALFGEEAGVFEERRRGAWYALGAAEEGEGDGDGQAYWEEVRSVLAGFVERRGREGGVDEVVAYGDAVEDGRFKDVLREVLEGRDRGAEAERRAFDPVFAGAAGVAEASFLVMDDPGFEKRPSWSCAWRSSLYTNSEEETDL